MGGTVKFRQFDHALLVGDWISDPFAPVEVPPLHPRHQLTFVRFMPKPCIETQLMFQRGGKQRRGSTRFDIDDTDVSVPAKHQVKLT